MKETEGRVLFQEAGRQQQCSRQRDGVDDHAKDGAGRKQPPLLHRRCLDPFPLEHDLMQRPGSNEGWSPASRAGEAEPQAGAPRGLLKAATDTTAQISLDEQDLKQRCIRQGPLAPLDFKYAEVSAV